MAPGLETAGQAHRSGTSVCPLTPGAAPSPLMSHENVEVALPKVVLGEGAVCGGRSQEPSVPRLVPGLGTVTLPSTCGQRPRDPHSCQVPRWERPRKAAWPHASDWCW